MLRLLALLAVLSLALRGERPCGRSGHQYEGQRAGVAPTGAGNRDRRATTIDVPPGTYSLTSGQLVANDNNLTLRNQPGASIPIIQSTGNFRVLCVTG